MVKPAHPFQSSQFDGLTGLPGSTAVDQFRFVQAVDGLGQGIVVAVPFAAHGRLDTGYGQAFAVLDRYVLRRRLSKAGRAVRHAGLHVAQGQLLRQCANGEPLGQHEERNDSSSEVRNTGQRRSSDQGVHRNLLQPPTAPLTPWLRIASIVRR